MSRYLLVTYKHSAQVHWSQALVATIQPATFKINSWNIIKNYLLSTYNQQTDSQRVNFLYISSKQ